MREGIYYQPDTKNENSLVTGFTVHYYKGLVIKPFTSCTLDWVIGQALNLPYFEGFRAVDVAIYKLETIQTESPRCLYDEALTWCRETLHLDRPEVIARRGLKMGRLDLLPWALALECCLHFKAHDENGEVPDLFFQAADAAFATD